MPLPGLGLGGEGLFGWVLTPSQASQVDVALLHLFGEIKEPAASGAAPHHFADALGGLRPQRGLCPLLSSAAMVGGDTQSTENAVKKLIFQQSSPPHGIARRWWVGGRTGAEAQSVLEWLPARCQPFSAGDGWVAGDTHTHDGSFLSSPVLPLARRFHNPSKQGKAPSVAG